ncbi:Hsp33 family molecular chaperone HslO [Oceanicoccus sp. KOV_DT_Chl]|uniref:Hsp33 family molecular chaperone HslO n=1 Tax=Oceanicoccus sp. KOV_DT_Chl TaxID=1904639 RepID=UPI000C7DAF25|nr:Hsp33 family molecular chaperone HslO [Oceanicoccus sp. KOV_DT_Chl]
MSDQLQRFIFDDTDIRGELSRLDQSYHDSLNTHQYPEVVAQLIGEFLAAVALLSATLKFEGTLTLQARSDGEIPLIMAEATSENDLRAIARGAEDARSNDFKTLLANGQLSITIEPKQGKRYQGIVSLDGANLAECLEGYFQQSEQLSTRIWLSCDHQQAAGMLLQELPASHNINPEQRQQQWQHLTQLADTITAAELLALPFDQILYRLYHQEQVRIFDPTPLQFKCSCSEQRTLSALRTLGQQELTEIIADQGSIEIHCEFCHQHYQFAQPDIDKLFQATVH